MKKWLEVIYGCLDYLYLKQQNIIIFNVHVRKIVNKTLYVSGVLYVDNSKTYRSIIKEENVQMVYVIN